MDYQPDVTLVRIPSKTVDYEAYYQCYYEQSPHYPQIKLLTVRDNHYALIGGTSYQLTDEAADALLRGVATDDQLIASDCSEDNYKHYRLKPSAGTVRKELKSELDEEAKAKKLERERKLKELTKDVPPQRPTHTVRNP